MTAPTLARILAAVSDRRTPEALHSALRGALAAHPDLPVTLDAELGLHWHGAPDGEDAGAFHAFARTVSNRRTGESSCARVCAGCGGTTCCDRAWVGRFADVIAVGASRIDRELQLGEFPPCKLAQHRFRRR